MTGKRTWRDPERARAAARALFAETVAVPDRLTVAEWAKKHRKISADSMSPYPGDWSHDLTPYLIEPMEAMTFGEPGRDIVIKKSAQTGFTESAINAVLWCIDQSPRPILYLLPSLDEASKFNRLKLDPSIRATGKVRHKIATEAVKGTPGSTASIKKFTGGSLTIANAHSSSALQMVSAGLMIADEISEYPADAGGRGDPLKQAEARTTTWMRRGLKRVYISTPGNKGSCRISEKYDESDQRKFYPACPHCGWHQRLEPDALHQRSETKPYGAYFVCAAHGCVIETKDHDAMIREGHGRRWIKTYEDPVNPEANPAPPVAFPPEDFARWRARGSAGRDPGFHIWQAYSLFVDWNEIVEERITAKTSVEKERPYVQQVLGEDYETQGDAPDSQKLFLLRGARKRGTVPAESVVLTGAIDVQGNRLEWAVYGWHEGMTPSLIDYGIVVGDTTDEQTWTKMGQVLSKTWRDTGGITRKCLAWAVDAAYNSAYAYKFSRSYDTVHAIRGEGAQGGRAAQFEPILQKPQAVDFDYQGRTFIGGATLTRLGSFPLKQWAYGTLRKTLIGPDEEGRMPRGAARFVADCDQEFFEQITAEYLKETESKRTKRVQYEWVKRRTRNEQLDLFGYCRAVAEMAELQDLDDAGWAALRRRLLQPQPDLFGLGADALAAQIEADGQSAAKLPRADLPAPESIGDARRRAAEQLAAARRRAVGKDT